MTITVGEKSGSIRYVTAKQSSSKELCFYSIQDNPAADIYDEKLLKLNDKYNNDPKIHGF